MIRKAVLASALALAACSPGKPHGPQVPEPTEPAVHQTSLAEVGLDASAMNRSADPCVDFYQFACGGWEQQTEIPGDQPRWNRSFSEIHERNQNDLRAILEALAASPPADAARRKLGDFWTACMDEAAVEKAGLEPIAELLTAIETLAGDLNKLEPLLARLHARGVYPFFDIDSGQDFRDATKMIAHVDQNGLGLPDRDLYLKDDEKSQALRRFYHGHVERLFALSGYSAERAKKAADDVMALETAIAKISKTRVERRDPEGMYNKIDRTGLVERGKGIDWKRYLEARALEGVNDINVTSVPFIEGLGPILDGAGGRTLAHYLRWHLLHATAAALPKKLVDEDFALTKALTGQEENRARWKLCVEATDGALGELLAQPYVEQRFSPKSRDAVEGMVSEISKAFARVVHDLAWMDDATRSRALAKLLKMEYLIGYPDDWKSYDFEISRTSYAGNVLSASAFDVSRELAKIGKPVDRQEWLMTPPTVNAYYNPLKNQMVFPAGILQPPFFAASAGVAVNMGGMGMVVGHELTHGFDDKGSQFDAFGNLKSWWAPEVRGRFDERTKCVEEQYADYEALPGLELNGKLTLGENIADAGGVKLAFHAFRSMRRSADVIVVAEGFSEDQQFFLSLGQVWCSKYREDFARLRAQTDTHSPPRWRVNGSLRNTPEFAQAFACPAGAPMQPPTSCSVW
jgi:putative endopeptidase